MRKELSNVTLMVIDCVNTERAEKALAISSEYINFGEIKFLTSLETKSQYRIKIPHISNIEDFSKFCIQDLHKYVDTEFVLLVQWDGFVINSDSWEDEFLNYDYIGAPWMIADWAVKNFNFPESTLGTWIVGNGGFSLRSKKFLETSYKLSLSIKKYHPEDVAMCIWNRDFFESRGIIFAPVSVAKRFSIEGRDQVVYSKQFGFHDLSDTDISDWINVNHKWGIKNLYNKE